LGAALPMRLRTDSLTLARPCFAMLSLSASMMLERLPSGSVATLFIFALSQIRGLLDQRAD
jgi:hypothetical protein